MASKVNEELTLLGLDWSFALFSFPPNFHHLLIFTLEVCPGLQEPAGTSGKTMQSWRVDHQQGPGKFARFQICCKAASIKTEWLLRVTQEISYPFQDTGVIQR